MSPILEVRNVCKRYGGLVAVDDVSITIKSGETVGLVGPNGAGKTTIIDMITGVQKADTGSIVLQGEALSGGPWRRARRGLARSFQHPQLASELTVRQNIELGQFASRFGSFTGIARELARGLFVTGIPDRNESVSDICNDLHLGNLDRRCGDLPLGEQRLAEVARALAQNPSVLVLDEPFAGSDSVGAEGIAGAIRTVRESGRCVVLVDHNVDLIAALADRIVLLNLGRVVFDGPPDECLRSEELRSVYFGTRARH